MAFFKDNEIMEQVFMHLNGKELMTASLVCPSWYGIIGQSSALMKKLKIVITYNERKPETFEAKEELINSTRKYQNITMYNENSTPVTVPANDILILTKSGCWSEVKLKSLTFLTNILLIKFFSIFEPTVTKMYLSHINYKFHNDSIVSFKFPKLQILKTRLCTSMVQFDMFRDCKTLIEFKMQSGDCASCENEDNIRHLLCGNKGLKVLTFDCAFFYRIFEEDISKLISFQLKELKTTGIQQKNELADSHFNMFLNTQADCLEKLDLGAWMGRHTVTTIINNMTALHDLTICKYELLGLTIDNNLHNLEMNHNIKTLNVGCPKARILKMIIAACPNTESLTVGNINNEFLMFASSNLTKLKKILIETEKSPVAFIDTFYLFKSCELVSCQGYEK